MPPPETDPQAFKAYVASLPTPDVLDLALEMTQERLRPPTLDLYTVIEQQIDFMRGFEAVGTEPTEEERESVTVGVIAVRNFEEVDPEYFRVLIEAAYRFRHGAGPR